MSFDVIEFRKAFPQLERQMGPNRLVYFDNGASTLKHAAVSDRVNRFNRFETANVHRGAHQVSRQGTEAYERARRKVAEFLGDVEDKNIIFTRGTTESINLVASCMSDFLSAGDEILITPFEHHSNIVPWQVLAEKLGVKLVVAEFDPVKGMQAFEEKISERTKLASFIFYSNSMGHRLPVEQMIEACKANGVPCLLDAAQAVLAEPIDLKKLDCDFLCFSGHKIFGPFGIGALYIKPEWADRFKPYQTGGSMIDRVSFDKTTYANSPQKFEAGTPNITGAIGLGVALETVLALDFEAQHKHVLNLRNKLAQELKQWSSVEVYDFPAEDYTGVLSFNMKGAHPSDVGSLLDKYGIAVRAGHHCCQPLMDLLGVSGTVRVSFAAFNTEEEVDYFIDRLKKVETFFV